MKTFPTLEARTNVHNTIRHQLQGKCSRNDSMRIIGNIIEQHGVSRMPIFGYSVRILQYYGDLPIISIEGAQFSDDCPVCKRKTEVGYLRTQEENLDKDYDIIVVNCLDCGCMYSTKGDNHRKYALAIEES